MKKPQKKSVKKIVRREIKKTVLQDEPKIRPLGSRVLIRPFLKEDLEKKNSFGLILPDSDKKEKAEQGIVLAVGAGTIVDGKLVAVSVKIGDAVAFSKYGFDDIEIDNETLYLIKEENILAVLKNKSHK